MSLTQRAYRWDDYAALLTVAAEGNYRIGTYALLADPTLATTYPLLARNMDTEEPGFTAHSLLLYATQDCLVRFNGANRVQHTLLAGFFYTFNLMVHTVYFQRVAVDGTLYVYAEG